MNTNFSLWPRLTMLLVGIAAIMPLAKADTLDWDVRSTQRGSGRYSLNRMPDANVNQVTVILSRNGSAEVRVQGDRSDTFKGSWNLRGRIGSLNLTDGFGQRMNAGGTVTLDRARKDFESISFSGQTSRGFINVNFRKDRGNGNDNGNGGDMRQGEMGATRDGTGTYQHDVYNENLVRATVTLIKNGTGQIIVQGRTKATYTINWRRIGNRVSIGLTGMPGSNGGGRGSGSIDVNREFTTFSRLTLNGSFTGMNINISFTSNP